MKKCHDFLTYVMILSLLSQNSFAMEREENPPFESEIYYLRDQDSLLYEKGNFPMEKDEEREIYRTSWNSPRYERFKEDHASKGRREVLCKRIKKGKDGRKQVADTLPWPYSAHGQIRAFFKKSSQRGTGTLVGPHHLLTAGHVVYDHEKKEWPSELIFMPGKNGDKEPFGQVKGSVILVSKEWFQTDAHSQDFALVILEKAIGPLTGWYGLLSAPDLFFDDRFVHVSGYPGDKPTSTLWSMGHTLKKVDPYELLYDIDTYPGQSGSGVWLKYKEGPHVAAVHVRGEVVKGKGNQAVRLSLEKFNQIHEWIENYQLPHALDCFPASPLDMAKSKYDLACYPERSNLSVSERIKVLKEKNALFAEYAKESLNYHEEVLGEKDGEKLSFVEQELYEQYEKGLENQLLKEKGRRGVEKRAGVDLKKGQGRNMTGDLLERKAGAREERRRILQATVSVAVPTTVAGVGLSCIAVNTALSAGALATAEGLILSTATASSGAVFSALCTKAAALGISGSASGAGTALLAAACTGPGVLVLGGCLLVGGVGLYWS
jgi:V8-like Glu-specific endopeptidase